MHVRNFIIGLFERLKNFSVQVKLDIKIVNNLFVDLDLDAEAVPGEQLAELLLDYVVLARREVRDEEKIITKSSNLLLWQEAGPHHLGEQVAGHDLGTLGPAVAADGDGELLLGGVALLYPDLAITDKYSPARLNNKSSAALLLWE